MVHHGARKTLSFESSRIVGAVLVACACIVAAFLVIGLSSLVGCESVASESASSSREAASGKSDNSTSTGGSASEESSDSASSQEAESVADNGVGDAKYEPDCILVTLPEGSDVDQLATVLAAHRELEGVRVSEAISDSVVLLSLPEGLSVPEAIDLALATGAVEAAQPNYIYYANVDEGESPESIAQLVGAAAALGAEDVANPDEQLRHIAAASVLGSVAGTALGNALGVTTQADADDPHLSRQWALPSMNAPAAWDYLIDACAAKPASGYVTVAVLDAGFDANHEDLRNVVVNAYDVVDNDSGVSSSDTSSYSHGTHVAGIVGAQANNAKGIAGVAYNTDTFTSCKVMPIKVADDSGEMSTATVVSAYEWLLSDKDGNGKTLAEETNTRVVNMSLGSGSGSTPPHDVDTETAINKAWSAGIVSVAAACNWSSNAQLIPPCYALPSDFPNVVSVISLDRSTTNSDGVARTSTSNYNVDGQLSKDIAAPGGSIYSTVPGGYDYKTGTSMATPAVSAVLALEFRANPSLTADEAVSKLFSSAKDLTAAAGTATGWDRATGYGEANALAAVDASTPYLSGDPNLAIGSTVDMNVKIDNVSQSDADWSWTTSDSAVATVSAQGVVTGVSEGEAIITAKKGEHVAAMQTINVASAAYAVSNLSISIPAQQYDGTAKTPAVSVYDGRDRLTEGDHYTLTVHGRFTNAGVYSGAVTITGILPYTGSVSKPFVISKAPLSRANVQISPTTFTYDGTAKRPTVTVRDIGVNAGKVLSTGVDYRVTYDNATYGTRSVVVTATSSCANFTGSTAKSYTISSRPVPVYRLFNKYTGEHFFTLAASEYDYLGAIGWSKEGIAWNAPSASSTPVYRLFNRYSDDHHYTTSASEYDYLGSLGWSKEGIAFYSGTSGTQIYRLYNPYASTGAHHYTSSASEYDALGKAGWRKEGIGWYAA